MLPLVHYLSLQMSGITKYCSFREITTKSSCVFGFLSRHIFTAESLSDLCCFLWSGNTAKGDCGVLSPIPSCSVWGTPGPAWLLVPFMETVLGLIIPSCASSPSPAGLCVPVSSASTPHSHRSQGEIHWRACAHTQSLHRQTCSHTESIVHARMDEYRGWTQ